MAKKKSISVASRKAKGREFQQYIGKKISEVTGLLFGADEDIASREMGQPGTDIRLSRKAREAFPYSVECKRQETLSIPAWIEQAKKNTLPDTDWLLFCRRSREKAFVIMDVDHFFELFRRAMNNDSE